MRALRWLVVAMAAVLACKTALIEPRDPISVPAGLNANDVEVAILYELADQNVPTDLSPGERIADNAMKALFLFRYQRVSDRRGGWYPESAEPGLIHAGFQHGPHYLRVAISYNDSSLQIRLLESRNLSQTAERIHKSALAWIDQLDVRIRRALGQMAAIRAIQGRELDRLPVQTD